MICDHCRNNQHGSCINLYDYTEGQPRKKKKGQITNSCVCQHKSDRPWTAKYVVPQPEGAK